MRVGLSVSTQSQGGHRLGVGVGGSEIRPGQRFQVQDQAETDRAGLGGAGRSTARLQPLQQREEPGERRRESHLPHSPGGRSRPRSRKPGGNWTPLTSGSGLLEHLLSTNNESVESCFISHRKSKIDNGKRASHCMVSASQSFYINSFGAWTNFLMFIIFSHLSDGQKQTECGCGGSFLSHFLWLCNETVNHSKIGSSNWIF